MGQPTFRVPPSGTLPARLPAKLLAVLLICTGGAPRAFAQERAVEVTGGNTAGQVFEWTIHNGSDVPIVAVEIPHYRAVLMESPDGWETDCTNLVSENAEVQKGICKARATSVRGQIFRDSQAKFMILTGRGGAEAGHGEIVVEFADGLRQTITGVELPTEHSRVGNYAMMGGFGVMLVIFAAARRRRQRRQQQSAAAPGGSAE